LAIGLLVVVATSGLYGWNLTSRTHDNAGLGDSLPSAEIIVIGCPTEFPFFS
jgi:hypothetical protein